MERGKGSALHERDFLRSFMIAMQMYMAHADRGKTGVIQQRVFLLNTAAFVCQQTSVLKNSKQKRENSTWKTRTGNYLLLYKSVLFSYIFPEPVDDIVQHHPEFNPDFLP